MQKEFGKHYIIELSECDPEKVTSKDVVAEALVKTAREAGATIIGDVFHQFTPQGASGVILVAESHFSIHTWPEAGYAAADFFTCSTTIDPDVTIELLKKAFGAVSAHMEIIPRGIK